MVAICPRRVSLSPIVIEAVRRKPEMVDEKLYKEFQAMSPKERTERIQALYGALLEQRGKSDGTELPKGTIAILETLPKYFELSIKFDEIEKAGEESDDAF